MKLEVGDKLVCVNVLDRLVYGETYTIVDTTNHYGEEDICIDVDGQLCRRRRRVESRKIGVQRHFMK